LFVLIYSFIFFKFIFGYVLRVLD